LSAPSSLVPHPPALRARRRQGTRWAMARVFAPAVTLSVSGIALEAPTIIVSLVYASPQACMIRIIAFVLAGRRLLRGNRRSKTVGGKRPVFGSRDLADLGRAGGAVSTISGYEPWGMLCRFAVMDRRSAARPGWRCRPLSSAMAALPAIPRAHTYLPHDHRHHPPP
jgi:hypothetical protein